MRPEDKDMVVMHNIIRYNDIEGQSRELKSTMKVIGIHSFSFTHIITSFFFHFISKKKINSIYIIRLIIVGDNAVRTAMAKTVGLPLAIATRMILNGSISLTGIFPPPSPLTFIKHQLQFYNYFSNHFFRSPYPNN